MHWSKQDEEHEELYTQQQAQIKQGWSLLATLHCVLLPDKVGPSLHLPPTPTLNVFLSGHPGGFEELQAAAGGNDGQEVAAPLRGSPRGGAGAPASGTGKVGVLEGCRVLGF